MRKVYSIGGKEFTVTTNGGDIHMEWIDPPAGQGGDALFSPTDACTLGKLLTDAAFLVMIGEDD